MIQFTRLRINGFKSFVDRTELDITPGLNGIVGPNGCGKSNLVEALRWAMGESSAKRMRGGGMEDVIFNGTDQRSQRNIAEVSILLDNTARTAPAAYNDSDEIEVVRRIERDHGSTYKINGKIVRARDVQMLFADTVTGANSPALVSQGKVTQIINSKPLDRRLILEESAGISGLYARRHEAELRLKAADKNLIRVEDILGSMESRLNALKRQSRMASRYRNINAQIRQLEVLIAWFEWSALEERIGKVHEKFSMAESEVAEHLAVVTQLTKTQNTQMQSLPALRQKEAEAAAALQSQNLALQKLEDEAQRHEEILQETGQQMEQAGHDQDHEKLTLSEASGLLEKLESEQKSLQAAQDNAANALSEKQKAKEELEAKVTQLEERYTALMQSTAESKARKQSLEQQIEQNAERRETIKARKAKAEEELKSLTASQKKSNSEGNILNSISNLENKLDKLNEEQCTLENRTEQVTEQISRAREALRTAEAQNAELQAEITMLRELLEDDSENAAPVLDQITAESGYEKALSRVMGEALLASLDENAKMYWADFGSEKDMPALPGGVSSLLDHVKAPKELRRALSQTGFVKTQEEGRSKAPELQPGQSLVCLDGTTWRWDGLCKKAEASDRNALQLEQKNKLKTLEKKRPQIETAVKKAQEALNALLQKETDLEQQEKDIRQQRRSYDEDLTALKLEAGKIREDQARFNSEVNRLQDIIDTAGEDIQTLEEVIRWDRERLAAYEKTSSDQQEQDTEKLRETLAEARDAYQDAVRAFDTHQQQQSTRQARLHAIADERISLQNRSIRARERLKQLQERREILGKKLEELKAQPSNRNEDKEKLLSRISEYEGARSQAAEKLSMAETEVSETSRALKEAEANLSGARETRAHAKATVDTLKEQQEEMQRSITEQFEVAPQELKTHAAIDPAKNTDNLETLRTRREKLQRERDSIGPVNLRADEEAQELEKEVTTLLNERNDLMQAIDELRGGIAKINKEARERLLIAFDHVNAHFQRLFVRLFGGGKAHLALIDSDDPLGAGLEIFAQPPGKTLQSLSLLSGGEQTLASIALIFAMFLTNPSPICVLDEIDAPLDDANVDRVCDLLEEIAERGETRFVIITHHRMTMARMDRLYGVTMAEKGVSQLVSVDLQQSFDFLEAA